MTRRAFWLGLLTGGVLTGLTAVSVMPAAAQGSPVGGRGNHYYFAGAGNESGQSISEDRFGDADDEVYVGDFRDMPGNWAGDGYDELVVRRGNTFTVEGPSVAEPYGQTFSYGDPTNTAFSAMLPYRTGNNTFYGDGLAVRRND